MAGLQKFNGLVFPSISDVLDHDLNVSAVDAPFREEKDFIPGSLRFCKDFWENEILVDHPDKQMLLGWLDGVKIEDFLNEYTRDVYKGRSVQGRYPQGSGYRIMFQMSLWTGLRGQSMIMFRWVWSTNGLQ